MIEFHGVRKAFHDSGRGEPIVALENIDLMIRDNEFLTVIGPSGCGKTTMLRMVAGLTDWDDGEVLMDGSPIAGPSPDRAMVFQNFALLPWASVIDNVAFGLRLRHVSKAERHRAAAGLLRNVGLEGFEHRLPRELSGGMQQRVGLARALAVDPSVLLMDEPFGALDEQTRRKLQEELLGVWEREPKTVLFVTHSMAEAILLADRIALMTPRPGKIQEIIENPLPRPRPRDADRLPAFVELLTYLWEQLRQSQGESGTEAASVAGG